MPSFSSEIKSELIRIETKSVCCLAAEICGMIVFGGIASPERIRISTENAATARRCFSLIKDAFKVTGVLTTNHSRAGKGSSAFGIEITGEDAAVIYKKLELDRFYIRPAVFENACCRRAFLRGAFLGGGSAANPEKEYHLEFSSPDMSLAEDTVRLFSMFGLCARIVERKGSYVVYFKNSGEIGDVLNIIGATGAYMAYMNVRILKETRNKVNRRVNCENANIDKTLDAAAEQLAAIRSLRANGVWETLSPKLRETAAARFENPEMSLSDLGKMLGVGKSGINHRMRKLMEMANKKEGEV